MRRTLLIIVVCCFSLACLSPLVSSAAELPPKERYLQKLADELKYGMEYKRLLTIQSLGRLRSDEAHQMLITAMLRDKSNAVRRAAQRELANIKDANIVPAIQAALEAPERRVRLAAIEALGLVRDPAAAEALLGMIRESPRDTEMILLALEAMRELVYRTEPARGFEIRLFPLLQHRDVKIRLTTIAILGILARPTALEPLSALWQNSDDRVRVVLADAFANIGWAPPAPLLVAALETGNTNLVIHSLYALSQIQAFSALGPIRTLLKKNHDARVRIAGVNALIEIPDPENVPAILQLLSDNDSSVRHWAAYALGQLHAQGADAALEARLSDPSSLVRASAIMALAEMHISKLQDKFLAILSDRNQDSETSLAAAKALMSLGCKAGAEIYWNELERSDLDLDSRLTYGLALGATGDERFAGKLLHGINSTDFRQALVAALALSVMKNPAAKPMLIQSLEHGNPAIRRYAILGLANLRDPESLRALAATANDDRDPLVKILCASNLVAAGLTDFRVVLWNALDNKDEDQRAEAIIALGRSADGEVLRQLKWYLRREPSVPVRETIWRVLREHQVD